MRISLAFIILGVLLIIIPKISLGQNKWYANTSLQVVGSKLQDGNEHNLYFMYGGIRYQTQNYVLGFNLPLVLENKQTVDQLNGSEFRTSNNMNSLEAGVGDLYFNGSFNVVKETAVSPNFSIDGYVKFPTASNNLYIGSRKFDYQIAVGIRKFINHISLWGQLGYLFLGNSDEYTFKNPITISIGIGYIFGSGEHSILFAFDSFNNGIKNSASPQQLALGYNYKIHAGLFFTTFLSSGLNNASTDYTISGGLNFSI